MASLDRGEVVSGSRVLAALGVILLATAIVPPVGAFAVNRARMRAASAGVAALAEALREDDLRLRALAGSADVLCGPGRMPLAGSAETQGWVSALRVSVDGLGIDRRALAPDPWGNCYLVDLAAAKTPGAAVRAISAGPDGIIDTPFAPPADPALGDDVGVRVR